VKTPKEIARRNCNRLLGQLNDEAFTWIAMALQASAMTKGAGLQIFPDGMGGFIDRDKLEELRLAAVAYIDSQR
jgi:hypothetical protein